jgi:hypothetical protein
VTVAVAREDSGIGHMEEYMSTRWAFGPWGSA